jgi:hypothetical protein
MGEHHIDWYLNFKKYDGIENHAMLFYDWLAEDDGFFAQRKNFMSEWRARYEARKLGQQQQQQASTTRTTTTAGIPTIDVSDDEDEEQKIPPRTSMPSSSSSSSTSATTAVVIVNEKKRKTVEVPMLCLQLASFPHMFEAL